MQQLRVRGLTMRELRRWFGQGSVIARADAVRDVFCREGQAEITDLTIATAFRSTKYAVYRRRDLLQ